MLRIVTLFTLACALAGCALSEDSATINYQASPAARVAGAGPVGLTVVDGRTIDRDRISTKINGFGMDMAAIRSSVPVPEIVRAAMQAELDGHGFKIAAGGRAITVTVDDFYNDFATGVFAGTATAKADLAVSVANGSGPAIFTQAYHGTATNSVMIADGSNAAETLTAALHDALQKLFADQNFLHALVPAANVGS